MPWAKLDDRFDENVKVLSVPIEARLLYVCGLTYAARALSDGFIPAVMLGRLVPDLRRPARSAAELVRAGLWEQEENGWRVHDWTEYNPSAALVKERRAWDARRMSLHRDRQLVGKVRERDGDHCRYCGQVVDWTDRRGPTGGTYDHIEPRGPNSLANVVVACRSCNSRKGERSASEVGMVLRPAPVPFSTSSGLDTGLGRDQVEGPIADLQYPVPGPDPQDLRTDPSPALDTYPASEPVIEETGDLLPDEIYDALDPTKRHLLRTVVGRDERWAKLKASQLDRLQAESGPVLLECLIELAHPDFDVAAVEAPAAYLDAMFDRIRDEARARAPKPQAAQG